MTVGRIVFAGLILGIISGGTGALAQSSQLQAPMLHPDLSPEKQSWLAAEAGRRRCPPAGPIAVSAYGIHMGSSGDDSLVEYPNVVSSKGGAWPGQDTFMAPCRGEYSFSISFNTDSAYTCPSNVANQDDVEVYFVESTPPNYQDTHRVGSPYGAWRGELADDVKRGEAAYTLNLWLQAGDVIQTKVHSDGNGLRCLQAANFSAVRIP